ncbi:phospholipase A2 [Streptomyces sp. NPDC014894]|uniref:phospholipase A2 n=1 Tax=unclassified Streptomyces TaxID=2593676 RepID=UPI003701580E
MYGRKSALGAALVSGALVATALAGAVGTAGTAAAQPAGTAGAVSVRPAGAAEAPARAAGADRSERAAPAAGAAVGKAELRRRADRIMKLTYRKFARAERVKPFNWRADGCSVPMKDFPYKKRFRSACDQHDFGYRNYGGKGKLKLSPTRATRKSIDAKFYREMKRTCDDAYRGRSRTKCKLIAANYHLAVRAVGGRAFGYR